MDFCHFQINELEQMFASKAIVCGNEFVLTRPLRGCNVEGTMKEGIGSFLWCCNTGFDDRDCSLGRTHSRLKAKEPRTMINDSVKQIEKSLEIQSTLSAKMQQAAGAMKASCGCTLVTNIRMAFLLAAKMARNS